MVTQDNTNLNAPHGAVYFDGANDSHDVKRQCTSTDPCPSRKDRLFADAQIPVAPFEFNEAVTEVFDDMIKRSVPLYMESIRQQCCMTRRFYQLGTFIYDLGCSHGNFGVMLHETMSPELNQPYTMIAVDSSESMLEKYRERLDRFDVNVNEGNDIGKTAIINIATPNYAHVSSTDTTKHENPETCKDREFHIKEDKSNIFLNCSLAEDVTISNASVVIVNLTMQFIKPHERDRFIQGIYQGLVPGGILLLSEKVIHEDGGIAELQREFYEQFKRDNGYSDLEISRKRDALENILIPESIEAHKKRLEKSGFKKIDVWLKWFNFASMIAVK